MDEFSESVKASSSSKKVSGDKKRKRSETKSTASSIDKYWLGKTDDSAFDAFAEDFDYDPTGFYVTCRSTYQD